MSYQQAELSLNRTGNILVGGMNQNPEDGAKSNGCGKSTIFSALSWALTGETINKAKEVSNIYTGGKTEVAVDFDIDGVSYRVIRTKKPSNLFFYVNGENKSGKGIRDTEQIMGEYIPRMTSSLLNSVIILGQGLPQRFTNNTPAGRKAVLETLAETDFMIIDLRMKIDGRKADLQRKKRELEDFKLQYETTKRTLEAQLKTHEQDILFLEDEGTIDRALAVLGLELQEHYERRDKFDGELETLDGQISDIKEQKKKVAEDYDAEHSSLVLTDTSTMEQELIEMKSNAGALERKIREFESVTDVCPTCGQKLPDVHKIDTTSLRCELDTAKVEIKNKEVDIYNIRVENNEIIRACTEKYSEQSKKLAAQLEELENEFKEIAAKSRRLSTDISEKEQRKHSLELRKASLEKERETLEKEIEQKKLLIEEHDKRLYDNSVELEEIKKRIEINSKMSTLIQRDFRGHLLSNVISFIEEKAKEYSVVVFGTDKLEFKLDKNSIDISYNGKDYSCLSGGEKQKLDVIIQFAIRDMMCTFLGFSSNILVLDEITDALDVVGVSKVFNLISENLTDVEAVYIISHHIDELEIPADDEIIIIKGDDNISRIV